MKKLRIAVEKMERGKYYILYYDDNTFSIFLCSKPLFGGRAYGHHVHSSNPNTISSLIEKDLKKWESIDRKDIKLKSSVLDKLESIIEG